MYRSTPSLAARNASTAARSVSRLRNDSAMSVTMAGATGVSKEGLHRRASAGHFLVEMGHGNSLRIPESHRHDVEQIFKLTDPKRPSPLARGDLRIWAAAAIYAVGSVNFLFDRTQRPHLTGDDLSALTGVPKSTLANKAKVIRDVLRIGQLEPEFCRRALLESNPMAWMISVDGFIVDARTMPPEVQEEARRRGLIPALPA